MLKDARDQYKKIKAIPFLYGRCCKYIIHQKIFYSLPIDYQLLHAVFLLLYRQEQWKECAQYEGPAKNLLIYLDHFERQYIKNLKTTF